MYVPEPTFIQVNKLHVSMNLN